MLLPPTIGGVGLVTEVLSPLVLRIVVPIDAVEEVGRVIVKISVEVSFHT